MNRKGRFYAAGVMAVALGMFAPGATAQTVEQLSFISEPGDPVGLGQQLTMSPLDEGGGPSSATVSGLAADGRYTLHIRAPKGQHLVPGVYENAHGGEVEYDPDRPMLFFQHNTDRCSVVSGRFVVTDVHINLAGYVERLRASFEQRCAGSTATLWGQVDIVKPAVEPPGVFEIDIAPFVDLVKSDYIRQAYSSVFAHFTAYCSGPTGGTFEATLRQEGPRGTVTTSVASDRFGCDPQGSKASADFPTTDFKPGPATLTIDAFVADPVLGEEGGYYTRLVTERVVLRPTRP